MAREDESLSAGDPVWDKIREAAKRDADAEPLLSSYMYMSILSHETLEQAMSFVLANRLADSTLLPTQLMEMFNSAGLKVSFENDRLNFRFGRCRRLCRRGRRWSCARASIELRTFTLYPT